MSLVKTVACSPYSVSRAMVSASSTPETGSTPSTGPKISSRAMSMSGFTLVEHRRLDEVAGAVRRSRRRQAASWRLPPCPSRYSRARASRCSRVTIEPISVAGSSGSPSVSAFARCQHLVRGTRPSPCGRRSGACWRSSSGRRSRRPPMTAWSTRSSLIAASSSTMNGLLPPISRPTGFRLLSPEYFRK